jgi:hypothetical protein
VGARTRVASMHERSRDRRRQAAASARLPRPLTASSATPTHAGTRAAGAPTRAARSVGLSLARLVSSPPATLLVLAPCGRRRSTARSRLNPTDLRCRMLALRHDMPVHVFILLSRAPTIAAISSTPVRLSSSSSRAGCSPTDATPACDVLEGRCRGRDTDDRIAAHRRVKRVHVLSEFTQVCVGPNAARSLPQRIGLVACAPAREHENRVPLPARRSAFETRRGLMLRRTNDPCVQHLAHFVRERCWNERMCSLNLIPDGECARGVQGLPTRDNLALQDPEAAAIPLRDTKHGREAQARCRYPGPLVVDNRSKICPSVIGRLQLG